MQIYQGRFFETPKDTTDMTQSTYTFKTKDMTQRTYKFVHMEEYVMPKIAQTEKGGILHHRVIEGIFTNKKGHKSSTLWNRRTCDMRMFDRIIAFF